MQIKENGGFTVAGDRAFLSLPLGETYHAILIQGDVANGMTLDLLSRIVIRLNERIIWDIDPRRLKIVDEYVGGQSASYPNILPLDFTEPDAKDPISEFLGSIGTALAADGRVIVESLKIEIYAINNTVPLAYLRSHRRISDGRPLANRIKTLLPYTMQINGAGKWDLQIPKGANTPNLYKRHWLFERRVSDGLGGLEAADQIARIEVFKNDRTYLQLNREINEFDQRRYKGVPHPEMFCVDYIMYNYGNQEFLDPTNAQDLFMRVETTGPTYLEYFQESYTDFFKGAI